jgi:hypothetical protein
MVMKCWIPAILSMMVVLGSGAVASSAEPTSSERAPQTVPPDLDYGTRPIGPKAYFPDLGPEPGRVDRRQEINPLADRTVLWPTAHTPEAGTWLYSNYMFLGNQLSYAKSDDLLLSLGVGLPYENTYGQASAKWVFHRSRDLDVALVPFGALRVGRRDFASSDAGVGLGLVADVTPNDMIVFSAGVAGYGTLFYRYHEVDSSGCQSRSQYIEGACLNGTSFSKVGPAGGHWLAGYVGITYYSVETIFFNLELTYGATRGSFFGTETLFGSEIDREQEIARYLEGPWGAGVPYGRGLTGAFGVTGVHRNFAGQFSIYMVRGGEDREAVAEAVPVFTAAIKF